MQKTSIANLVRADIEANNVGKQRLRNELTPSILNLVTPLILHKVQM